MMERRKPTRETCFPILLAALVLSVAGFTRKTVKDFRTWPAGASPEEIGDKVAERFLSRPHTNFGRPDAPQSITYPESVAWYGALTFAQASRDRTLAEQLIGRFDPLFTTESNLVPAPDHVDHTVFGIVPLEIYIETRQKKYLDLGLSFADRQWDDPRPDGLTKQTRMWIDDMYMITMIQLEAFRATGNRKYLDRAALEMTVYLEKLQQPNGLFYHAPDAPFFWGRGNGWVAAGMAEMLRSLPAHHPERARILGGYRKMMASLLEFQGRDGMWRQLIDHAEAWPETSSTAMFTFAIMSGVENGWLDRTKYAPAARRGWLGLVSYLNPDGDLRNVCAGTGKGTTVEYYLDRPRLVGDLHAQAPLLWSATALLRSSSSH
jgi:unsaturated rhamnogalacturonyl hydrolase